MQTTSRRQRWTKLATMPPNLGLKTYRKTPDENGTGQTERQTSKVREKVPGEELIQGRRPNKQDVPGP